MGQYIDRCIMIMGDCISSKNWFSAVPCNYSIQYYCIIINFLEDPVVRLPVFAKIQGV